MQKICNLGELLASNFSDTTVKTLKKFGKRHLSIDINDVCAQRRLGSAWPSAHSTVSSLCALWVAKDTMLLHADSDDSDQTARGAQGILLVL